MSLVNYCCFSYTNYYASNDVELEDMKVDQEEEHDEGPEKGGTG